MRQSLSLARMVAALGRPLLQVVLAALMLAALAAVSPVAGAGREHGAARPGLAKAVSVIDPLLVIAPNGPRYAPVRGWLDRTRPDDRLAVGAGGLPAAALASDQWLQASSAAALAASWPGILVGGTAAGSIGSRAPPLTSVDSWS
jgi:hypothetical protein